MAHCVDLRSQRIVASDAFLLDTNIARYLVDIGDLGEDSQKRRDYSRFVAEVKRAGAALAVSVLSFYELVGIFESVAFRVRTGRAPAGKHELKAFRTDAAARRSVLERVRNGWEQLAEFATILDARITEAEPLSASLPLLARTSLDGYDPLLVHVARQCRISNIVTDDADFRDVDGLVIFTTNPNLLSP